MKEFINKLVEELLNLENGYSWEIRYEDVGVIIVYLTYGDDGKLGKKLSVNRFIRTEEIENLNINIASWLVNEMKQQINPSFIEFKPR